MIYEYENSNEMVEIVKDIVEGMKGVENEE